MNPLSRLVEQAEVNLAGMARRAVDSVTVPLRAKADEVMAEARHTVLALVRVVVIKVVLAVVAALALVVALVYALGAIYQALLPHLGPVEAGLVMAAAFAAVAVVALLLMLYWPTGEAGAKAAAQHVQAKARQVGAESSEAASAAAEAVRHRAEAEAAAAQAAAGPSPFADNLHASFDTVVNVLGEAGFRREQAGLKAGIALASQLKPMQLVSLALLGGFVAALRTTPRRRR